MTCTHQWHDATTKAGPEWVCAHCKAHYSDTKKVLPAKRAWVGLTVEKIDAAAKPYMGKDGSIKAWGLFAEVIEEQLKGLNT